MKKVLLLGGTGLVGQAIYQSLKDTYQVIVTAGHQKVEGGWQLKVEEPARLCFILDKENPDIVISSLRGNFQAQMQFHEILAGWLSGKEKKLLFISTANVFDGDLSRPWTEADMPVPESDYGIYKRDCEAMLQKKLKDHLIIFRLSAVWAKDCPRLHKLKEYIRTGEAVQTFQGEAINISLADQIGWYAKYVLDHELSGVFHVGTLDTVDYFEFEKMVCKTLGIPLPAFEIETVEGDAVQAVIPARSEIPQSFQMTVEQVLQVLKGKQLKTAQYYIEKLGMEPHVEGGYFKECLLGKDTLMHKGDANRNLWSSIYFLLQKGEVSHFHRLESDEVWYFHDGSALTIYMISPEGELTMPKLGLDVEKGELPQILVPKGYIFGSAQEEEGYSLVGCMVAPSFRYEEFYLYNRQELLEQYPKYRDVIVKLTRE